MNVLVTGAGGFVCRHICEALFDAGYHVIAVDRAFDADLRERWKARAVTWIESDLQNLPPAEYLIHGAAVTATPEESNLTPEDHFRANIEPLLHLLAWARRPGVQRVLFISSAAVLRTSSEAILTEDTTAPVSGLYAAAKTAMEALVRTYRVEYGVDAVTVRLGNIYGTMESARPTRPKISRAGELLHDALATGTMRIPEDSPAVDWTFAADVGRAFCTLLQLPTVTRDLYHVSSGEALNLLDIAMTIQKHLPHVTLEMVDAKIPFRGIVTSQYFATDTGFKDWTRFADGIAHCVHYQKEQFV